jgi:hypothetical protein
MKNNLIYFIVGILFVIFTSSTNSPAFDNREVETKIVINKPASYTSFKLLTYDKNSERDCRDFLKQYESYLKLGYQIADRSTSYPNYILLVKY